MKHAMRVFAINGALVLAGCAGQPTLFPNTDPNLQKTSAQFAADAAKRHPYKLDAPRGGDAPVNAVYDLNFGNIQLLNYGDQDLTSVEVWINKSHCCFVPTLEKGKARVKVIYFTMLYDDSGLYFSTDGGKNPIRTIELYYNNKMWNVPTKLAD